MGRRTCTPPLSAGKEGEGAGASGPLSPEGEGVGADASCFSAVSWPPPLLGGAEPGASSAAVEHVMWGRHS